MTSSVLRRRSRLVLPAAVAAIALVVTGCSSDSSDSAADAGTPAAASSPAGDTGAEPMTVTAVLDKVSDATADAKSVRGTLKTTTPEGELDGTFAFEYVDSGVLAEFGFAQGGKEFTGILTPDAIYLGGGDLAGLGGAKYMKIPLDDSNPLGQSYAELTKSFSKAGDLEASVAEWKSLGDLREAGTEQVAGVQATKYVGTLDPQNPPAGASSELAEGYRALADQGVTSIDYTLWIGEDGLPVRFSSTTKGDLKSTTVVTYEDWGADVDVTVPSGSEVADLSSMLGGR